MKSMFLVLLAPVIGTMGQLFLKLGMRQVGELTLAELKNNTFHAILSIFTNMQVF